MNICWSFFIILTGPKNLIDEAIKKSEELQIEQAMLDDKLKATDWEATNEELMEMVARESYLQWIKDNEINLKHKLWWLFRQSNES